MSATVPRLADALRLAAAGLPTFPCGPDKKPRVKWRESASSDPATIREWWMRWPDSLPALATGEPSDLWMLDCDVSGDGEPVGERSAEELGIVPAEHPYAIRTRRGGGHLPYRWRAYLPRNTAHRLPGIDSRGEGGYVIALDVERLVAAAADPHLPEPPVVLLDALAPPLPPPPPKANGHDRETISDRYVLAALDAETRAVANAAEGTRNDTLNRASYSLGQLVGAGVLGRRDAEARLLAAALTAGLPHPEALATIRSGITAGAQQLRRIEPRQQRQLRERAEQRDQRRDQHEQHDPPSPPPEEPNSRPEPATPHLDLLSEDAVAAAFVGAYRGRLLFDHTRGCWLEWSDSHWRRDDRQRGLEYARRLARAAAASEDNKVRLRVGRASFASGVERLARGDFAVSRVSADFDRDPWLLGTPGGTVDLRTGKLRPADPTDGITKLIGATPAPSAACPRWLQFLHETMRGDADLIDFLQRWSGYCLTGLVIEHVFLLGYGDGGRGKGTFAAAQMDALGDYATAAPMELLMELHGDRHPADIASLVGARLAVAQEVDPAGHGRPCA
jgi:hypothetical protein